jgi:non-lysosomal glucosylceramidase
MKKALILLVVLTGSIGCRQPAADVPPAMPEYSGEALRNIFYPLGGIGTGNILLGGRGNILEFEIFNRAQRDELPPYMTLFSIWYREEGEDPGAMVLERQYFDNFTNGFGVPRQQLAGLPRFREATWSGAPPAVGIDFKDGRVPLEIRLECFNPLVPLDVDASSMPLGEFSWILTNPGGGAVTFSLALTIANPFKNLNYRSRKPGHPVRNSGISVGGTKGIYMESLIDPGHPDFGNMVVAAGCDSTTLHTGLIAEGWWDDAHILWGEFSENGTVTRQAEPCTAEGRGEVVATLLVHGTIEPGQSVTIPFYFTWYVPNRVLEASQAFGADELTGHQTRNYYATRFEDARDVLAGYLSARDSLKRLSERFYERMTATTVPLPVRDAALSNLASLKSNLLGRMENGDVHGYEGLGPDFGCCPGNCTHVWNYAQSMASLFPSLERNIRETACLTQTFESGYQCFRTTFPIGDHHFRNVAADGQMGNIMRVYREWKFSGDSLWLAGLWPSVKRCIEYAWHGPRPESREGEWTRSFEPWDPERQGVLTGRQHNTYDIDFYGPNMLTGGLYLGALKACSEMADYLGDGASEGYLEVYASGRAAYDSLLWNGSWYVQHVEEGHEKYQYGNGCLSDQLLGQYLAFNSGMGYILDPARVKSCLQAIFTNNFIPDFTGFQNVQRVYALNREGGMVLCTWPGGDRELIPFPYADETWTGVEYQVAASLIWAGLVEEGVEVVEAVRKRYAGCNRNPYAEIESGFYYARALSSWSVLLAMSGFRYDGSRHSMAFDPAIGQDRFSTFWSCGTGWGNFLQTVSGAVLELDYGTLDLKELSTGRSGIKGPASVLHDNMPLRFSWNEEEGTIVFDDMVNLSPAEKLTISFK